MSTDVLEHYGIKGMKWGVRRSARQLAGARKARESADSAKAKVSKKKAKKGGVKALSNTELSDLNKRMNLEQNYSRLTEGQNKSRVGKGAKWVGKNVAKDVFVQGAKEVAKDQVASAIRESIKR